MQYKVKGSGGRTYEIDTDEVTCTCHDFKYQHRNVHTKTDTRRLCKHLKQYEHTIKMDRFASPSEVHPNSRKGKHSRKAIEVIMNDLKALMDPKYMSKYEFCGSYRRGAQICGDIDMLISDANVGTCIDDFIKDVRKISDEQLLGGPKKWSYVVEGIQVDMRIIPDESWAAALLHYTGSVEENIRLRRIALSKGYSLSEYGLMSNSGVMIPTNDERMIYTILGQPFRLPSVR